VKPLGEGFWVNVRVSIKDVLSDKIEKLSLVCRLDSGSMSISTYPIRNFVTLANFRTDPMLRPSIQAIVLVMFGKLE